MVGEDPRGKIGTVVICRGEIDLENCGDTPHTTINHNNTSGVRDRGESDLVMEKMRLSS